MRYYIAINMLITAGIGYVLRNANPGEFFNACAQSNKDFALCNIYLPVLLPTLYFLQ